VQNFVFIGICNWQFFIVSVISIFPVIFFDDITEVYIRRIVFSLLCIDPASNSANSFMLSFIPRANGRDVSYTLCVITWYEVRAVTDLDSEIIRRIVALSLNSSLLLIVNVLGGSAIISPPPSSPLRRIAAGSEVCRRLEKALLYRHQRHT